MASKTKRVTITIPQKLLDEIRSHSNNVSGFLAEAAAERLRRERYQRSVAKSFGAWTNKDHPELSDIDDIATYVAELRGAWNREV